MTSRTRWIAIALALVGATLLALAVLNPRVGPWWSISGDATVGPAGISTCVEGVGCSSDELSLLGDGVWLRGAMATLGGGVIAGIALIALAASLAAKRRGKLAAGATLSATLTAMIAAVVFVASFPGVEGAALGRGALCFVAGIAAALGASLTVLRTA